MKKNKKTPKLESLKIKKLFAKSFYSIIIIALIIIFVPNIIVCLSSAAKIKSPEKVKAADYDCIMILGAGLVGNQPSLMLGDRLDAAALVYKNGAAKKIIVSGDHSGEHYNEVGVMKTYLIEKGIPSSDIFMDHAGLSTYESLYRAKNIFGVKKLLISTQPYHLYRAIYLAKCLGLDAAGVAADGQKYNGQIVRDIREVLARDKDFILSIFTPEYAYPSDEKISLLEDGDITNDEAFYILAKNIGLELEEHKKP